MQGCLLPARIGIAIAADVLDFGCDVLGRARACALERHVLNHVREAGLLRTLVTRAATDPDTQGRALQMRHGVRGDDKSVLKFGNFDAHDVPVRSRTKVLTAPTSFGSTV